MFMFSRKDPKQPAGARGYRAYVVGDVHGRLDLLGALLDRIHGDIANREDARIPGTALLINDRKPALVHFDLRLLQCDSATIGAAADRDQNSLVVFDTEFGWPFECHFDFVTAVAKGIDFGVEVDAFIEQRVQHLVQRLDQIAIRTGQQTFCQFDDADFRT